MPTEFHSIGVTCQRSCILTGSQDNGVQSQRCHSTALVDVSCNDSNLMIESETFKHGNFDESFMFIKFYLKPSNTIILMKVLYIYEVLSETFKHGNYDESFGPCFLYSDRRLLFSAYCRKSMLSSLEP